MKKGKLIVIDGTDGSGKATQTKLLIEHLQSEGHTVHTLDFPQYYQNFFGKMIGEGLKGDYGDWAGLHPKIASVVYAADRFESSHMIQSWIDEGAIVILDRYVSSNQIHQGGKVSDEKERREFMTWLDTMEHEVFKIPRPDLILYLDVPLHITQKLIQEKENQESKKYLEGKGDQHENNLKHLEDARESGLKMIAESNNWVRIECSDGKRIFSIEKIQHLIINQVLQYLYE